MHAAFCGWHISQAVSTGTGTCRGQETADEQALLGRGEISSPAMATDDSEAIFSGSVNDFRKPGRFLKRIKMLSASFPAALITGAKPCCCLMSAPALLLSSAAVSRLSDGVTAIIPAVRAT